MLILSEFIEGEPKAQPRPKATTIGKHARVYNPKTADGWKNCIKFQLAPYSTLKAEGALRVDLTFYFQRPKSHFGTGKNAAKLKDKAPRHHVQKPDIDNLEKAVWDACTDLGVWKDDCQIVESMTVKHWAHPAQAEGMKIEVFRVR